MEYKIDHLLFKNEPLTLQTSGLFSGPKIFQSGREIKKKKRAFEIFNDKGEAVTLKLKARFIDPVPNIIIGEQTIVLERPIKWFEYAWICLPILWALHGGLIGAILGYSGAFFSVKVFRSGNKIWYKYTITGLISLLVTILVLSIATLIERKLKK